MKNRSVRILSLLCAVILMTCAVSALAEETPATPTDLQPAGSEGEAEDAVSSIEVIITKTLTIGESWSGRMKKTKPAVLKLDVNKPGPVYVLVEGKDVWATVEKSDRMTENPTRTQTDPETNRMILSWEAEEGSYLITLGPVEPNLLAMADVTVMNQEAYNAWEAEQEEEPEVEYAEEPDGIASKAEGSPETAEESAEESNGITDNINLDSVVPSEDEESTEADSQIENEQLEDNEGKIEETPDNKERVPDFSEDRFVEVSLVWDVAYPILGDTAHLSAKLIGYDNMDYTLQWQNSHDKNQWSDVPDATDLTLDVIMTKEINNYYWRLVVYLEESEE